MFVTIWMCTQEWSLISRRLTAFTLDTCHHALIWLSSLTLSTSVASLRFARVGTLIRICPTASAGVRRVSSSACSGTGSSIRSRVSLSSSDTVPSLDGCRGFRSLQISQLVVRDCPGEGEQGRRQGLADDVDDEA